MTAGSGDGRAPASGDGAEPPPASPNEALKDAVEQALEEARMVLPGIQALFGFQLIAVFNQRFDTALDRPARWCTWRRCCWWRCRRRW